jgi:hypothetical protein
MRSFFLTLTSQLSQHRLGAGNCNLPPGLFLGVDNLAVVNNQCVSGGPLAQSPIQLLRECGADVGEEEL